MLRQAVNPIVLSLFLYIVVPCFIIGFIIRFGPGLIRNFFVFLFAFFKFFFNLIFKKSSSKELSEISPDILSELPHDVLSSLQSHNYQNKNATPGIIIHETPRRIPESLTISHIRELSPKYFEIFIGIILGKLGFYGIKITGRSHDGGIDLEAYSKDELYIVQCKRYGEKLKIRAKEIRELYGNAVHKRAKGLFVTTGEFTKDATKQTNEYPKNSIDLLDGGKLLEICKQNGIKTNKQLLEEILKTYS